jgi:hypothetical protein
MKRNKKQALISWVQAYYAHSASLGEYGREMHECKHGHVDCAMVPRGRCFNETLAELESLGVDPGHTGGELAA